MRLLRSAPASNCPRPAAHCRRMLEAATAIDESHATTIASSYLICMTLEKSLPRRQILAPVTNVLQRYVTLPPRRDRRRNVTEARCRLPERLFAPSGSD